MLKEKEVKSLREQLIAQLYEKSLIVEKIQQKYSYYQFIYYLLIITDNNFDDEFEVKNEGDIDILLKFVNEYGIKNLSELKMKASIVKHVESSLIYFDFSD